VRTLKAFDSTALTTFLEVGMLIWISIGLAVVISLSLVAMLMFARGARRYQLPKRDQITISARHVVTRLHEEQAFAVDHAGYPAPCNAPVLPHCALRHSLPDSFLNSSSGQRGLTSKP
jgi:hypothetical protein